MRSTVPLAFAYPSGPLARRHGPAGYFDLQSFRPWLRDEFSFRCVYCLIREQWGKQFGEFDLEHFVPVSQSQDSSLDYDNLLYSCHPCNLRKGSRPVPDPTQHLLEPTIQVHLSGRLSGLTDEARRTIAVMCLNSPNLVRWRLTWMRIIDLCHQHDPEFYHALMSYPVDLPDLAQLKPPENTRPEGVSDSYYVRRTAGKLP
jgi:hypothetical protein